MNKTDILDRWTKEKSEELYSIKSWGANYFSVSDKGEVLVTPYQANDSGAVSLMDIISSVPARGRGLKPAHARSEALYREKFDKVMSQQEITTHIEGFGKS